MIAIIEKSAPYRKFSEIEHRFFLLSMKPFKELAKEDKRFYVCYYAASTIARFVGFTLKATYKVAKFILWLTVGFFLIITRIFVWGLLRYW